MWLLLFVFAFLFDVVNILLGFLDFLVIGLILSPIWNAIAVGTLGVWLWIQTGQDSRKIKQKKLLTLTKRIAVPFIGNSIPISKFFPWWIWSVWSSYREQQRASSQSQESEEQPTQEQAQTTPVSTPP